jgi:O-antigen/teichoic acid export membrane protein
MAVGLSTASAEASTSKKPRSVAQNLFVLVTSQVTTWSLAAAWTVVVPRSIGPGGVGRLVAAWAAAGMMSVFVSLGTYNLLVRRLATDSTETSRLVGSALLLRAALSAPGLLLMFLYIRMGHFDGDQIAILWIVTGTTLTLLLIEPFQAVFQARERMEYLAYTAIVTRTGVAGGAIVLVLLGFGPVALAALGFFLAVFVASLTVIWIRGYVTFDWRIALAGFTEMARESWNYWAFSLFFTLYLWIDTVLLSLMTSPEVVGWYGVPTRIWGALMFAPVIVSTAILPRLSQTHREGRDRMIEVARPFVEAVLIISLPVTAGVAMIAGPMIHLLYRPDYAPAIPVLIILAISAPPTYLSIMLSQLVTASGRPGTWAKVMAAALVVNLPLNLMLIPLLQSRIGNGAVGAAVALLATELMVSAIGLTVVRGVLNAGSVTRLLRAALAALGMACVLWAIRGYGPLAQIPTGMVSFIVLALFLRVPTATEISLGRKVLSSRLTAWTGGR